MTKNDFFETKIILRSNKFQSLQKLLDNVSQGKFLCH